MIKPPNVLQFVAGMQQGHAIVKRLFQYKCNGAASDSSLENLTMTSCCSAMVKKATDLNWWI